VILFLAVSMIFLTWNGMMAEVEVKVLNFEFNPRNVTIPAGETIKWSWEDGIHTTTNGTGSGDPQSGTLWNEPITASNQTFSYTFTEQGVFPYYCIPHEFFDMKGTITVEAPVGIGDDAETNSGTLPRAIDLSQNYPNPFNPSTTFTVRIPDGEALDTALRIYNIRGSLVSTVVSGRLSGGEYHFSWNGKSDRGEDQPSGIYIYRLDYGDQSITKKMTMLK
jgi:plastocyanin